MVSNGLNSEPLLICMKQSICMAGLLSWQLALSVPVKANTSNHACALFLQETDIIGWNYSCQAMYHFGKGILLLMSP